MGPGGGDGRRLNLDAAVILLTPLYIRIARHRGVDPVAYAFQPALLACLASSALPVSNLTNLIVVERIDVTTGAFVGNLGLPTLAACTVGYWAWRAVFRPPTASAETDPRPADRQALVIGAVVLVGLVIGFIPGRAWGAEPWTVVAVADIGLVWRLRVVPLRSAPWGTAVLVLALAILSVVAAAELPVGELLGTGESTLDIGRAAGLGVASANLINNLPAILVGLDALPGTPTAQLWALLLGVNIGPLLLVTGSLSGILWLDIARREGLPVGVLRYSAVGALVGVPAFAAALAILVLQYL